jgi:hypothetical protein
MTYIPKYSALDTQKYYVAIAHRLEALSDYARNDPEVDPKVAEHLKSFAENILRDVTLLQERQLSFLFAPLLPN